MSQDSLQALVIQELYLYNSPVLCIKISATAEYEIIK